MNNFLKTLLKFLLPIFILAYPLDLVLSKIFSKSYWPADEIDVMKRIYKGKMDIDIAIYGSSRAWRHFHPAIMKDSLQKRIYNMGMDGHNFWMQYYRHKEYLKYNVAPKYIIHSVDAICFERRKDLVFLEQFLPFMLFHHDLYAHVKEYEGFDWYDFYIPLWRYIGRESVFKTMGTILFNPKSNLPMRTDGYNGNWARWNDDFAHAKANNIIHKAQLHEPSLALYDTFLQECAQLGIKVILVHSPMHIDGQNYISNNDSIVNIIKSYASKYDLPYLDYTKDEICNSTDYFYNALHLNDIGANLFSAKLGHDLKPYID